MVVSAQGSEENPFRQYEKGCRMSSDSVAYAYLELRQWFESRYRHGQDTVMAVDVTIWGLVCGLSPHKVRDALARLESEGQLVVIEQDGSYAVCQWLGGNDTLTP